MSVFADSSALVKLYADEAGHAEIRGLAAITVAQIARVEVPAAIWRKHRLQELAAAEAGTLTAEFEADFYGTANEQPRFVIVATTPEILDHAAALSATHELRAYDAVQLASALAARSADPDCESIAAFDRSLRTAAPTLGLRLVPSET